MAITYRGEGRAKPWQVYWRNPFTNKKQVAHFATEEEAKKEDSLIKHRLRFDRESFRSAVEVTAEESTSEPASLTLEQVYLLYLKEKNFSKKSLEWQMCSMRYILSKLGSMPIAEISKGHILQVMSDLGQTGIKQATVRGHLSVLRTVMNWSADRDYCPQIKFPKLPAANYTKFIPPTQDEVATIMAVAPDRVRRVVILGTQTGARVWPSEMLGLKWEDVNFAQKYIRIHGAKKNLEMQWREVPLSDEMVSLMEDWHKADMEKGIEYLIHYQGKPVRSLKTAWGSTLEKAGITRRIRPYDLRHAFATEMIAGGADVGTVANLMGHSTPTMLLKHYQHVLDKQKRSAIQALPCITRFVSPNKEGATQSCVTP